MKGVICITLLFIMVGCCGPSARRADIDRAYESGRLTEYQYHKLKIMEKQAAEADTANYLTIINSGRK